MNTPLQNQLRFVTFRLSSEQIKSLSRADLRLGLLITWIVGMGRALSRPHPDILQQLGLGSVLYVVVLSGFLWALLYPIRSGEWKLEKVLTLVSLTALPGIIYAIPVELVFDLSTAGEVRMAFLILVAFWRVLLLTYFLKAYGGPGKMETFVATFLPLTIIIVVLNILNLDRLVFDAMSSHSSSPSTYDDSYGFLSFLGGLSFLAFVPLALMYLYLVVRSLVYKNASSRNKPK